LTKDKTSLIVAHRLSTIKEVDRIIVLGKGGAILQEGNHKKLIKTEGYYKSMHF
ncbi:MAG: multidrug ABC transporter ATP-binding protein, partial [Tenericutes bacterium]